ncbi:MAG: hypothetical protein V4487_00755 [Chlamydiota bacterium]
MANRLHPLSYNHAFRSDQKQMGSNLEGRTARSQPPSVTVVVQDVTTVTTTIVQEGPTSRTVTTAVVSRILTFPNVNNFRPTEASLRNYHPTSFSQTTTQTTAVSNRLFAPASRNERVPVGNRNYRNQ